MKVYIAGPMTGYENSNFSAFEEAARKLRQLGYEVVSPHELIEDQNHKITFEYGEEYDSYCKQDIIEMMTCGVIVCLPDWERSRGARTEVAIGSLVGIPNYPIHHFYRGIV